MAFTSWEQLINEGQYNQASAGTALTNTVALTDISAGGNVAGQALLLPASYLYPGLQLRVRARGILSTTGTPSLLLGLYFGGVAGSALAASTFTVPGTVTNQAWKLSFDVRVDAVGAAATIRTLGDVTGIGASPIMIPASSSTGGAAAISSGASGILTIGAQWGTASVSNSITLFQYLVEQLN